MPRTGPRRRPVGVTAVQQDLDALDAIGEAAGVSRADVVRAGIEVVLRGLDQDTLVAWLRERGRESSTALTPDRWAELIGHD